MKLRIINPNPKVCMTFTNNVIPSVNKFTTSYESAIVKGIVTEITDEIEKTDILREPSLRYCPENMQKFDDAIKMSLSCTAIFKVSMEEVTGKAKLVTKRTTF